MLAACLGAVVVIGVVTAVAINSRRSPAPHGRVAGVVTSPSPHPTPSVTPTPVSAPVRLEIPSAHVDAAIEQVGLDGQGDIGVPSSPQNVAWYNRGPRPGEPGDAIINGHVDWYTGPAVFIDLHDLKAGDQITVVTQDGRQLPFRVTSSQAFDANAPPPADLFATSGTPKLSLITCFGSWDTTKGQYQQRLVVTAVPA